MLGTPRWSALYSALLHVLAIAIILIATSVRQTRFTPLVPERDSVIYLPLHAPHVSTHGGGGGGFHSDRPASRGRPPKAAKQMTLPPLVAVQERQPQLPIEPAILTPIDIPARDYQFPHIGSPTGVDGPPSNGRGTHGGIGDGDNGGIGDSRGPGLGDGPSGPGGGINDPKRFRPPTVVSQHEPEYSDEARKAHLQGSVLLGIVVSATGQVTEVRVLRGLGLGLDERAIEAVKGWQFRPATLDGKPVAATATVDVTFRLL